MTVCHHCRQDIPQKVQWNGLMVTALGEVFWRGLRVAHITRTQGKILKTLARTGEASHLALELNTQSVNGISVRVTMSTLRRNLEAAGVPVAIVPVPCLGYRLQLLSEGESHASWDNAAGRVARARREEAKQD